MNKEREKKLVMACTIAGVLLVFFLFCVIIYQIVTINVTKKRINNYQQKIEEYQNVIDKAQKDLDWYKSDIYLDFAAREYGYVYPEDKK